MQGQAVADDEHITWLDDHQLRARVAGVLQFFQNLLCRAALNRRQDGAMALPNVDVTARVLQHRHVDDDVFFTQNTFCPLPKGPLCADRELGLFEFFHIGWR